MRNGNPAAAATTHLDDGAEPRQSLGQPEDAQHAQEPENDDGEHLHEDDEGGELHEAHADDEEVEAVPVAVVPVGEVAERRPGLGEYLDDALEGEYGLRQNAHHARHEQLVVAPALGGLPVRVLRLPPPYAQVAPVAVEKVVRLSFW